MYSATTIVGIRRGSETIVACAGSRASSEGLILKRKPNFLKKISEHQAVLAMNGSETANEFLLEALCEALSRCRGDIRVAASSLAKFMKLQQHSSKLASEAILAARGFLALINSDGDIIEPDEGFLAIGAGAHLVSGAIKALLVHSDLSTEQITRESLKISGQFLYGGHEEMSLEQL